MKVSYVLALLLCASFSAQAEIYKYVDDKGQVHYSNIPVKGAKKVDLPPLTVVPLAPEPAPAAAKEGGAKADQTSRRQTLETQLAEEEKKLEDAKAALKSGSETPDVFKTKVMGADGKPHEVTHRNVAKYQEKMQALQANVDLHQKNVDALKKELAGLAP